MRPAGNRFTLADAASEASDAPATSSHAGSPRRVSPTDPASRAVRPGASATVPILPTIQGPADLRGLDEAQLAQLAAEIRETIIATVGDEPAATSAARSASSS